MPKYAVHMIVLDAAIDKLLASTDPNVREIGDIMYRNSRPLYWAVSDQTCSFGLQTMTLFGYHTGSMKISNGPLIFTIIPLES